MYRLIDEYTRRPLKSRYRLFEYDVCLDDISSASRQDADHRCRGAHGRAPSNAPGLDHSLVMPGTPPEKSVQQSLGLGYCRGPRGRESGDVTSVEGEETKAEETIQSIRTSLRLRPFLVIQARPSQGHGGFTWTNLGFSGEDVEKAVRVACESVLAAEADGDGLQHKELRQKSSSSFLL
jgi:hypothetical protein